FAGFFQRGLDKIHPAGMKGLEQRAGRLSDHLGFRVAVERLRAAIPVNDIPVRKLEDENRVVRQLQKARLLPQLALEVVALFGTLLDEPSRGYESLSKMLHFGDAARNGIGCRCCCRFP